MPTSKSGEAGTTVAAMRNETEQQQPQPRQQQQNGSMPMLEKEYRCAVALNNMGVCLLERHAYRQALTTFHDALRVMRTVASEGRRAAVTTTTTRRRNRSSSSSNGASESDFLDRVLHDAEHRVAKPDSLHSPHAPDSFTHDDDDLPGLRSIVMYGPSGSMVFPVRINYGASGSSHLFSLQQRRQSDRNRSVDVDSSIMEYNLSLAHLCLSMIMYGRDENKSKRSARKALQHALNAHKTLGRVDRRLRNDNSDGGRSREGIDDAEAFRHARMLMMGGVVLSQMAQVLHQMGCADEMEKVLTKLNGLSNAVMETEQDETAAMCAGLSNKAAAAAA